MSELCNFSMAWIGKCKNERPCESHKDRKCCVCEAPATRECPETGQFVCGFNLCDDCEHTVAKNGTNNGIGFYTVSELPEGLGAHCRKSEQVYKPWYTREPEAQQ